MAQTAAHLADHVIPPVPVRQRVISVPKRLRGMLADRPAAVSALTKIFIAEIERLLCAAAGVTSKANTPSAAHPRLGGVSFLHRFGSALNHHVHLHACVTDGVFVPAADEARCDTPPALLPARPITQADLATVTDTSRIAGAKLMARVGEEFPLECPNCGGDIRLIAFRLLYECETILGLRTLGNLRLLRTSCPRAGADPEDPHTPRRTARASARLAGLGETPHRPQKNATPGGKPGAPRSAVSGQTTGHQAPEPLSGSKMPTTVFTEVPLAGLSLSFPSGDLAESFQSAWRDGVQMARVMTVQGLGYT